ncbi:MAG: helix-turn-helix transcriptional regulator [Ardenticatenaceae bacterium]|nr:helix-turn-helix transcriptional regulator [Ardenticatenaceae bacterium]
MKPETQDRPSDVPFVEVVYGAQSVGGGSFISTAESRWEMVVTKQRGKTVVTVRGPETIARPALVPEDAEFVGIIFKPGVFMPHWPLAKLVDEEVNLPGMAHHSFCLQGMGWEIPTFENADVFVARLVREEMLVYEPVVAAVLENRPLDLSPRTIQRRFLQATGLTRGTFAQIERAQQAVALLEQGLSIADAAFQVGYADQPHFTRSLNRFFGQTPAQLIRQLERE